MDRRTAIRQIMAAGAFSLLPRLVAEIPAGTPQEFVLKSEVRLVLLDVSVRDRNGGYVEQLTKENFRVFENDVAQPITTFSSSDVPVTAGILVDESRSMTPKRSDVITAAETFISESNPQDELFVLNFNETVQRGLPAGMNFTDNVQQLRTALNRGVPEGRTALNDAVMDGLEQLEMGRRGKKALLVISDGGDNASRHTRHQMLDTAERSIATIYSVGIYDPNELERDTGLLKRLARITGGEAYFPKEPGDLESICKGIAKDIRMRYTLGYVPQQRNGAGALRRLRVSVSAPGHGRLVTRTRSEYRYES